MDTPLPSPECHLRQNKVRYVYTLHWRQVRMNKHGLISHHQFKFPKSQMVKKSPKNILQANSWLLSPFDRPVKEYEIIFCPFPPFLTSRVSIDHTQRWDCLNVQALFVHSVHTHVCQKELLRCSITALTAREHHRQKKKQSCFAFYVVSLKFWVFRAGYAGNF